MTTAVRPFLFVKLLRDICRAHELALLRAPSLHSGAGAATRRMN
jgi:hypothetical protein